MDNRTFGYARVSSREQHEDRQIEALTNYGKYHCGQVFRQRY